MAAIRSKGGLVLNKYILARVFDYDDHADEVPRTVNGTGHRDASIMVMQCRTSKKIALYDVATGKLRLMKRPLARGVG
jgi:hypothetical protein